MDRAPHDTRLNAQRKAYTAARSDMTSTGELADQGRGEIPRAASFDPFFSFFPRRCSLRSRTDDGLARSGASGLPGEQDEALARQAIEAAGLAAS